MNLEQYDENKKLRYIARLLPKVFGDGKQMIWLSAHNQRVLWYVRVDSADDLDGYHDAAEKILDAIIEKYGLQGHAGCELKDEDKYDYAIHYPIVPSDIFYSYSWGKVE